MSDKSVFKYPLGDVSSLPPMQSVEMPMGAQILSTQIQHGQVTLWALVDPSAPMVLRSIYAAVTGENFTIRHGAAFIGTAQFMEGGFVVHLFDLGEKLP